MKIRNPRSIIIIFAYIVVNAFIILSSFRQEKAALSSAKIDKTLAPEYTIIEKLDYFHLRNGIPQLSLAADSMRSQGEETAEFESPKGIYNFQEKSRSIRYSGDYGHYEKARELITLKGHVDLISTEAHYLADKVRYFFKKDLVLGDGNVKFVGDDVKTKDHLTITSTSMRAYPHAQVSKFKGNVKGTLERKKKYEGSMYVESELLEFLGQESKAHLEGDVLMKRQSYLITAGKADVYLENFNKSLKYFVLNDDVKVTETVRTPEGVTQRKAFSERLEGFGREEKMVLSGAPRVEMGKDVVKGYRITIRENTELIEVDDAMSELKVKREKKLKE